MANYKGDHMKTTIPTILFAACLLLGSVGASANPPEPGQYQMGGGAYSITVEVAGADLVVVEPNKRSVYTRQPDGTYHFRNPTNNILYGLRSAGQGALEAYKPDNANATPTRLERVNTTVSDSAAEPNEQYVALAEKYQAMVQSDPANTQSWIACSGVALKRAYSAKAEADQYARSMVQMLKQMDARATPCADVIPPSMF